MNTFECKIRRYLDEAYPCCTLSGVTLYRPDRFGIGDPFGYEIDNLLHWQSGHEDRLVIIECKNAPIEIASAITSIPPEDQEWYAPLPENERKVLKDQLFNQAESIWQNLCVPPNLRRRIDAFVVSSAVNTRRLKCKLYSKHGLTLHLLGERDLVELFRDPARLAEAFDTAMGGKFLRVAQSDLLRLARQSVIVPELGHPEIDQAIEMLGRCRQTLDGRLFDFFEPRERHWAINGPAGMGKSVLLAYAVTVFATGKVLRDVPRVPNERLPLATQLVDHSVDGLGLPPVGERRILAVGLKQKQLAILEQFSTRFSHRFESLADPPLQYVKPDFRRWAPDLDLTPYNVVCIDEAHDLLPADQDRIAEWWNNQDKNRYLLIACDRHQKLRLVGRDDGKWMLRGVPFSGCSTRLFRNYRSPTPIYCAGLALLFRWFARQGPKVIPEKGELEQSFGFAVKRLERRKGGRVALSLINDAHPGNHWRFTVSRFTDADAARAWLIASKAQRDDVLWVRFGEQDPDIDYEDIGEKFNFKPLNTSDSGETIDAEVKGREFPIVVIEGLPAAMATVDVNERVWALRRQVYLCASRATAFLFFVYRENASSPQSNILAEELDAMLAALASPDDPTSASTKIWSFEFSLPESPVSMGVFFDGAAPESNGTATTVGMSPVNESAISMPDDQPVAAAATNPAAPLEAVSGSLPEGSESPSPPRPGIGQPLVRLPTSQPVVSAVAQAPALSPAKLSVNILNQPQVPFRVHEVARMIGWESRDLLQILKDRGYPVRTISSAIDRVTVDALIIQFQGRPVPGKMPLEVSQKTLSPDVTPGKTTETPQSPLMSEKKFQRLYGQKKEWKPVFHEYHRTGVLPSHLKARVQAPPIAAFPGSAPPIEIRHTQPSVGLVASPHPLTAAPPLLSFWQSAQWLGVKRHILSVELMKAGILLGVDELVEQKVLSEMCRVFGRPVPTYSQQCQLAAIPRAVPPSRSAQ